MNLSFKKARGTFRNGTFAQFPFLWEKLPCRWSRQLLLGCRHRQSGLSPEFHSLVFCEKVLSTRILNPRNFGQEEFMLIGLKKVNVCLTQRLRRSSCLSEINLLFLALGFGSATSPFSKSTRVDTPVSQFWRYCSN